MFVISEMRWTGVNIQSGKSENLFHFKAVKAFSKEALTMFILLSKDKKCKMRLYIMAENHIKISSCCLCWKIFYAVYVLYVKCNFFGISYYETHIKVYCIYIVYIWWGTNMKFNDTTSKGFLYIHHTKIFLKTRLFEKGTHAQCRQNL